MQENLYARKMQSVADDPLGGVLTMPSLAEIARPRHTLSQVPDEIVSFHRRHADGPMLEQLRTLRSRVCEIASLRSMRSILITSALPAEGKSLVSLNLAFSLHKLAHKRILLADCDLRRPRIQTTLALPERPGMCEFLSGAAEFRDVGYEIEPGLDIIPARPVENAPELLHGPRMAEFLHHSHSAYDFVLLDSPPLASVADSELLVSLVDGVLFVVRADRTDAAIAADSANRIRPKLMGAVLNGVDKLPAHAGYYYYSAY